MRQAEGEQRPAKPATSLEQTTKLVEDRPAWVLSVCPAAGEAGGVWRRRRAAEPKRGDGGEPDAEHSMEVAVQRAGSQMRRFIVANRLNRLGTLTYAPPFCRDPVVLRGHVAEFFVRLRQALGGKPFPYLWVPELHRDGERFHVHFVVGKWIERGKIEWAWRDRGHVHIKLLGDLPARSSGPAEARIAAKYTSKYLAKDLASLGGLHRYEVAQNFQPARFALTANSDYEAVRMLIRDWFAGEEPEVFWRSPDTWHDGPPRLWMQWAL